MFTGTVNFDFRKFEKCAFFKKSPDHFQKLMFTGTVNFDFRKLNFDLRNLEKCAFFKINAHFLTNPFFKKSPIFKS